MHVVEPVTFRR